MKMKISWTKEILRLLNVYVAQIFKLDYDIFIFIRMGQVFTLLFVVGKTQENLMDGINKIIIWWLFKSILPFWNYYEFFDFYGNHREL